MIRLSELLRENKCEDFLCILNEKTKDFKNFFPNFFLISNSINEQDFFLSINNLHFMNLKIFFSNLEIFYKKEFNKQLSHILETNKNSNIISPLGIPTSINFINDMPMTDSPTTKILSNNFLKFHKLYCSLKGLNSILLTIFFHYSYNLEDLLKFFLNQEAIKIENSYNDIIFQDFQEGINFLLENNMFKEDFLKGKFFTSLRDYNLIKTTPYDTYIYWKNYFQEESLSYCECPYVAKEADNFTYYNLEKEKFFTYNTSEETKRSIYLELEKPEIINDNKKFYLENILNLKHKPLITKKKFSIKIQSLRSQKKTSIFKYTY